MNNKDIYEEITINQSNITVDIESIIDSYEEIDLQNLIQNSDNNDSIDDLIGQINNKPTHNRNSEKNSPVYKEYDYEVFDELEKLDKEFIELGNDIKDTIMNLDTHIIDVELESIINDYINSPT